MKTIAQQLGLNDKLFLEFQSALRQAKLEEAEAVLKQVQAFWDLVELEPPAWSDVYTLWYRSIISEDCLARILLLTFNSEDRCAEIDVRNTELVLRSKAATKETKIKSFFIDSNPVYRPTSEDRSEFSVEFWGCLKVDDGTEDGQKHFGNLQFLMVPESVRLVKFDEGQKPRWNNSR